MILNNKQPLGWLQQYINESLVNYPTKGSSPASVVEHLLYNIPSGQIKNGTLYTEVGFGKLIPYEYFYNDVKTVDEMKESLDDGSEYAIEHIYKRKRDMYVSMIRNLNKSVSDTRLKQLKVEAEEEWYSRYNDVTFATEETMKDLFTKEYFLKSLNKNIYKPHHLLMENSKSSIFTSKTNKDLVRIAICCSEAQIDWINKYIADPTIGKSGDRKATIEDHLDRWKNSIITLTNDIERLKSFINHENDYNRRSHRIGSRERLGGDFRPYTEEDRYDYYENLEYVIETLANNGNYSHALKNLMLVDTTLLPSKDMIVISRQLRQHLYVNLNKIINQKELDALIDKLVITTNNLSTAFTRDNSADTKQG